MTIVESTNIYILSIVANFQWEICSFFKYSRNKSIHGSSIFRRNSEVFSLKCSSPIVNEWYRSWCFHHSMSYKQFFFLMRCLRFDDIKDRSSRWKLDKLYPLRNTFELFVSNCKKSYKLGEYVITYKKLEPFRGRCSFIQCVRSFPWFSPKLA